MKKVTILGIILDLGAENLGVDIDEYNPLTDIDGKTAELGIELIAKVLGGSYSWYTGYMEKNKL